METGRDLFVSRSIPVEVGEAKNMANDLKGRRILVVEDSPVIAMATEDMLQDLGCEVVGPAGNLAEATELAEKEALDAAVIDLNIRGWKAFSVVDVLIGRGIPFLMASGYASWDLPEHLEDCPRLPKPYGPAKLKQELQKLFDGSE
jgi:CheY-like chemotaxis protein